MASVTIAALEFAASSTALELRGCNALAGNALDELAAALPQLPLLVSLDLARQQQQQQQEEEEEEPAAGGLARLVPAMGACATLVALSLADCGLADAGARVLADWLGDGAATPALVALTLSGNRRIKDQGAAPLLEAMRGRGLTDLELSACGLGVASLVALAALLAEGTAFRASIGSLALDRNALFGSIDDSTGEAKTADKSVASSELFLSSLSGCASLTSLSLSGCGLGPAACGRLAGSLPTALLSLAVATNPLGKPKPGKPAGVRPGAERAGPVRTGAVAALNGRWGEVTMEPDEDGEVKLRWLDTGCESAYLQSEALGPVVHSRGDLVEDYCHVAALASAVRRTGVCVLDLSGCWLNPASAGVFLAGSFNEPEPEPEPEPDLDEPIPVATQAPTEVSLDVSSNKLFGQLVDLPDGGGLLAELAVSDAIATLSLDNTGLDSTGAARLVASLPAGIVSLSVLNNAALGVAGAAVFTRLLRENERLRTVCGLREGVKRLDWKHSGKGPADAALLAADLMAGRGGTNTLRDVALDGCLITGTAFHSGREADGVAELDRDLSGFTELCEALPASRLVRVSMKSCYVGQTAVGLLEGAIGVPPGLLKQQAAAQNLVVVLDGRWWP